MKTRLWCSCSLSYRWALSPETYPVALRYVLDPDDDTVQMSPKNGQIEPDRASFSRFQGNWPSSALRWLDYALVSSGGGHFGALRNEFDASIFVVCLGCWRLSALRKHPNLRKFSQKKPLSSKSAFFSLLQLKLHISEKKRNFRLCGYLILSYQRPHHVILGWP